MKKQINQLLPTLLVMILILALTVTTYHISFKQEEESCYNRLENASNAIIQSIQNRMQDDLNYLRLIGKDFSNEDHLPTYEEYSSRLSTFEDVSLFERVDLSMQNNTMYTMHKDVQPIQSNDFLTLNADTEYMDLVHTDPFTNKKSVNYYVPIQQNDSVVAYLVGVIQCDTLDEQFYTQIYSGKTQNLIIDTTDGQVVMNNQDILDYDTFSTNGCKLLSPKKDVIKQIHALKSGVVKFEKDGIKVYPISAVSGQGVRELLFHVRELLSKCPKETVVYEQEFDPALGFFKDEPYTITRAEDGAFVVEGPKIEKMLGYTNMDSEKGFLFFQKFLREQGILKELEEQGIQDGDTVRMYYNEFDYYK